MLRKSLFVLVAALLAACGTVPPPAYEYPTLTFEAQERATTAAVATSDAQATLVALRPTATQSDGNSVASVPTTLPTETPTLVPPTATATEILPTPTVVEAVVEPTTAVVALDPNLYETDPNLLIFVGNASAAQGEELFKTLYQTEEGVDWGCMACHSLEPDVTTIGPSLAGIGTRAFTRIPDMGPYSYIFNSIRHPQDYIVEGFAENPRQMPHFLESSLTDDKIYHLIAYLMTLQ
jgi:cytochrome c2